MIKQANNVAQTVYSSKVSLSDIVAETIARGVRPEAQTAPRAEPKAKPLSDAEALLQVLKAYPEIAAAVAAASSIKPEAPKAEAPKPKATPRRRRKATTEAVTPTVKPEAPKLRGETGLYRSRRGKVARYEVVERKTVRGVAKVRLAFTDRVTGERKTFLVDEGKVYDLQQEQQDGAKSDRRCVVCNLGQSSCTCVGCDCFN
jgi:hypothetical protein